jgi:flagellar hook protein FlgE
MGLASALTTALTGMTAAETQIDVVGNNLANAQTVGFKASEAVFATQFLQTLGLGSAPTANSGGTNPRQTGLGTKVAEITPDFTQGTIEISSNPSDLAIQGDGFFVVQGTTGEQLFTRNGIFKTNADNELVTTTGNRLLGYGVDDNYDIQSTQLVPLTIPLGSAAVAQATQNVYLEGTLTPTGDVADTGAVAESGVLGSNSVPRPNLNGDNDFDGVAEAPPASIDVSSVPNVSGTTVTTPETGTLSDGAVYRYRIALVDNSGSETVASTQINVPALTDVDLTPNNNAVTLTNLPPLGDYASYNIYRTTDGGSEFFLLDNTTSSTYTDDGSVALSSQALDDSTLNGNYTYLITFHRDGIEDSRPSVTFGPQSVVDGRIRLSDLPLPPPSSPDYPDYDEIRIYRNLASDSSSFYLVKTLAPGEDFTDNRSDAQIADLSGTTVDGDPNQLVDLDGPKADFSTRLVDVLRRDGLTYENVFSEGTLTFAGRKGGRTLEGQTFEITSTTTLQDLTNFMEEALGIQLAQDDSANPIPGSVNNIPGETTALSQGITMQNGQIRVVSNNGVDNAIDFTLSSFQMRNSTGEVTNPNLGFGTVQEAVGQSAVSDFVVFDSLGVPVNVRLTLALESRTGSATTYRWFADSSDNDPLSGARVAVGTGLVSFDGEGNLINVSNNTISIDRRNSPAQSPLEFELDFSEVSGLAANSSSIAASRQDGSSTGTLTSYIIGEDGVIRGVFSSGVSRDLGQIVLARFGNPVGLEQRGENLFSTGVNSGLPVYGSPGEQGIGKIIAGAVELSNTDIGQNLIDLVLATTQYRGNSRVITAAQQLLEELLNIRR